jgi:two-component system, sensor histidine kinase and response regulator
MFTLLLVDDNPLILRALSLALRHEQYLLYSAQNGIEALELAQQIKPDLILLDVKMPSLDGFEVCKKLKTSGTTRDTPIIFLTALDEEDNRLHGFKVGGADYITKPFCSEEVSARVRVHLALRSKQEELKHLREQDQHYFAQINALREEVLDQMRHDLKNPLSSIKASTYLIKQLTQTQPSRIAVYTERIDHAVDQTYHLMERLLEIVKLETGRSTRRELVEIEPFIQKIADIFKPLAEAREIRLLTHLHLKAGLAGSFDPEQMHSVISNLLCNALKYTAATGKVSLQVSMVGQDLRFEVSDTGRGIAEQYLNKIFDRLYRVPEDEDCVTGTGLGLYIVKSVVEQHGGFVTVESKVGSGSTFAVSLPLQDAPAIT